MYVHAEASENRVLQDGDLSLFIRLGTDFNDNYYEGNYQGCSMGCF